MKKLSLITILSFLVISCGGSGPEPTPSPSGGVTPNNKTIYFEDDLDADPALVLGADDVAIVNVFTDQSVTKNIPFTVSSSGNYELCFDGGENIFSVTIFDQADQEVLVLNPQYSLSCLSVSLSPQNYTLKIANTDLPSTISPYIDGVSYRPDIPYIRLGEKKQIKSDVDASDWLAQLNLVLLSVGLSEIASLDEFVTPISYRVCYTAPLSEKSPVVFRQNSNKLLLSFKADMSAGSESLCTYVEAINGNPANPTNAGDIGDIDAIAAGFINSGPDSEAATSSLAFSRPRQGDRSVAIGNDIVIGFDGVLDRLTKDEAFTISPAVAGVTELIGSVITFNPAGALEYDTVYTVTLAGLSDDSGSPINDIAYTFATEKEINLTGDETALTNAQLCALGVSEYCLQQHFSTIAGFSVQVKNSTGAGSRFLEVNTTLDQTTNTDVIFSYQIYKDGFIGGQVLVNSGGFIIAAGKSSGVNYIELADNDFVKDVHDVTVKIQAYNVFNQPAELLGVWPVYNGEFFADSASVNTNDTSVAEVTTLSFLPGDTVHDRKLVVSLSQPASEEVNLKVLISNASSCLTGCNVSYDYQGLITINEGEQQKIIDVSLKQSLYQTYDNYVSVLTPSITDARNASFSGVAVQNETISVFDVINIPVASNDGFSVEQNGEVSGRLQVTEPNQLPMTYSVVNSPALGDVVVDSATGAFTYTATPGMSGADSFSYKVNNGYVDSNVATITLNVSVPAPVPLALDDVLLVVEDTVKMGNLFSIDSNSSAKTYALVSQAGKGAVNITNTATGAFIYTPGANLNGQDSFTFNVTDSDGVSNTAKISVDIAAVDDAPVAQSFDITVTEDESPPPRGDLLATDFDGDVLTYTIVTPPAQGQVVAFGYQDSTYVYNTPQNVSGAFSFTYKVNDGTSDSNIATVNVTITPVADLPVTSNGMINTLIDTPVSGQLVATDAETDVLTFSVVSQSSLGVVVIDNAATGVYTFTPNSGVSGTGSFTFKATDASGDSNISTISVQVYADATLPLTEDAGLSVVEDEAELGQLLAYSMDGDSLTYRVVTPPANGDVNFVNETGRYYYTPAVNFNGTDSFTFEVIEIDGVSNVSTVIIDVAPVEDVPVAVVKEIRVAVGETVQDELEAYDGDGDALTYSIVQQPSSGDAVLTGSTKSFTYTPSATIPGSDYFIWEATDSNNNSSTAVVFITIIRADNVVPIASNLILTDLNGGDVVEGDVLTAGYSYSDADADVEGETRLRWLRDGLVINGQQSAVYTVSAIDIGSTITFDVMPAAVTGREFGSVAVSNGVVAISPEVLLSVSYGIKQLKFSWSTSVSASYYKLFENPDGNSGFTQLGTDIVATNLDHEIAVHKLDWDNTEYMLQACDISDICTDSNTLSTFAFDGLNDEKAIGYFKASNTDEYDEFGTAIAISADGNTMIVGAPGEDNSIAGINNYELDNASSGSGAAYVFTKVAGVWVQQAYLKASNVALANGFGASVSISGDGNILAVGAFKDSALISRSGSVYIFTRNSTVWTEQTIIKASNAGAYDEFGLAVGISADGNTLVVGAEKEDSVATGIDGNDLDNTASGSGAAYVFKQNAGVWTQQAYLKASNAESGDYFGAAVSISADGSTVAVGAHFEDSVAAGINGIESDNTSSSSGASYVFVESAGVWSQQAYIKASNSGSNDWFGKVLSLNADGNTLVVGADSEDGSAQSVNGDQLDNTGDRNGAAYVFTRSAGSWSQQAYLKASNSDMYDYFGSSVSISDDGSELVIGAYGEGSISTGINGNELDNSKSSSGAVYFYTLDAGSWVQKSYIKPSNANGYGYFGKAVSVDGGGNSIAIGAPGERSMDTGIGGDQSDVSVLEAGAVYLY